MTVDCGRLSSSVPQLAKRLSIAELKQLVKRPDVVEARRRRPAPARTSASQAS
jgi:hypothetical protein